jgi:F-type H+-transporting ATPase subunit a
VNASSTIDLVQAKSDAVQAYMMHHMMDSRSWTVLPHLHQELPFHLTVNGVMVLLTVLVLIVTLTLTCRRMPAVPSGFLNAVEFFVQYIRDEIVVPFHGHEDGPRMTPVFCSFFFFVVTMNLLSLIPCFYTPTANLGVTGAVALVTFVFMTVGAIHKNGIKAFMKGFATPGLPFALQFVIVPLEIISMFIRVMALAIRLFANMLSGHLVLFSLLGLVVMFGVWALPAFGVALAIYLLEVFVAFLQAYIFTLLSAVFIGERYHSAH